jgi:hypothetical protein
MLSHIFLNFKISLKVKRKIWKIVLKIIQNFSKKLIKSKTSLPNEPLEWYAQRNILIYIQ